MDDSKWQNLRELIENPTKGFSREELLEIKENHPLSTKAHSGTSVCIIPDYVFRCEVCSRYDESIKGGFYNLIIDTLGGYPMLRQKTTIEDIECGPNHDILTQDELRALPEFDNDFKPEYNSSINYVKDCGYFCDSCFEALNEL